MEATLSDIVLTYPENDFRLIKDLKRLEEARLKYNSLREKNSRKIRALCLSPHIASHTRPSS